jgi:hypothetical protein
MCEFRTTADHHHQRQRGCPRERQGGG